jgi:hypothetical protein
LERGGGGQSDPTAEDLGLRRVGNPRRRRDHDLAVEHHLQQEHQLLRAGADQHVLAGGRHAVAALVVLGDGLAQLRQPTHSKVGLLRGVRAQRLDDGARHGERRLAQAQARDHTALALQLGRALVDRDGRGHPQPAHVHVEVLLRPHGPMVPQPVAPRN